MTGESGSRAMRRSSSEAPQLQVVTKGFEGKDECCSNVELNTVWVQRYVL